MAKSKRRSKSPQKIVKKKEDPLPLPPPPLPPVSSSDDDDDNEQQSQSSNNNNNNKIVQQEEAITNTTTKGYSRLFSPYRTLGIVSHGPFHLLPNQNSSNAMICAAIGERFHLMQCDKLHPVLVSQAVPAAGNSTATTTSVNKITHVLSDTSLSVSLVSHGSPTSPSHVTLFQRTRPIRTLAVCPSSSSSSSKTRKNKNDDNDWSIVDTLHLGRIRVQQTSGEKEGSAENSALFAVILSKGKPLPDDGVPVVGDDDDDDDDSMSDSDSDSSSDDDDSDEDDDDDNNNCRGQVVLLLASRTSLTLHKRIPLSKLPSFCPRVAVHPPTYVNKIVIGGSCSKTSKDQMILLNIKSQKVIHVFKCLNNNNNNNNSTTSSSSDGNKKSEITSLESSPAIDTIAVGTSKGMVHLINTRYDRLLFSLHHKSKRGNNGKQPVRITSMSFRTDGSALQYGIAPLAVGRSDGGITIWDLTPPSSEDGDEDGTMMMGRTLLCEMDRVHYPGGVHKLQYMPQEPLLLSTGTQSNSVVMHIFDNPDHSGRILRQRKGHTAPPKYIRYLHPGGGAGGGVLVNAGDGTDAAACQILSGGSNDRTLRLFSTVRSVLDKEYSQGRGLEKRARDLGMKDKAELLLPPVKAVVTSEARSRDWGDVVTIHQNHAFAYVWSSKRGAQSGPILRQDHWNVSAMKKPPPTSAQATCVTISACGSFALVGTKGGTIYKYNVQSGNTRGCYPINRDGDGEPKVKKAAGDIRKTFKELEKKMKISNRASNIDKEDHDRVERARREQVLADKLKTASHRGAAVTGVAVDGVNKTVISVGADSKLILWNFKTHAPHKKSPYQLPAAATKLCHVQDSDLAAVALEDYSAILFDCATLTVVRRFGYGRKEMRHDGPISDLGFSPDGRTLYTASMDSTIRVWDVPTNSCVDWMGFSSPPTSISVSPTGEFLATTHTGKLGISLWSDRSFYQTVHVDGTQLLNAPASMDEPAPLAEVESGEDEHDNALKRILASSADNNNAALGQEQDYEAEGPVVPKEAGLVTLSGLPPAHWKNLFHLELVKQRNKPTEPPKKPPSAPFFLQWRSGEDATGELSKKPTLEGEANQSDAEWDAVWSDDDDNNNNDNSKDGISGNPPIEDDVGAKRERESEEEAVKEDLTSKRRKVTHYRSHLAALLEECDGKRVKHGSRFGAVTEHIASLGPSAIDVSFSALCNGMHDLDEGMYLLILACRWLVELCESRERFEATNAYLHRFLHLHSAVLAGIGEKNANDNDEEGGPSEEATKQRQKNAQQREELLELVGALRASQSESSDELQGKLQNALCLLRHFSRMV